MGRRRILAVLCAPLLWGAAAPPAAADDKPHLIWVASASPPTHIDDKRIGPGIADETLAWFIKRLPEFEHEIIVADSLRLENMMATGDGVCSPALVKSAQRQRFAVFSKPVYWAEPARLVANAARSAEIDLHANARGEIDLAAVLDDARLSGARLAGRSYSTGIDAALDAAKPGAHLAALAHANEMDMLANGRFDWTIALPIHIAWWSRGIPTEGDGVPARTTEAASAFKIITRPVAGEPDELEGYMACSDRELGRRAIAAIDRVIDAAGPHPPWAEFYLKWLDPDSRADWLRHRQRVD